MPFAEDLLAYLSTDDFATAATYNSATVYGIFERQYLDQLQVQTSAPTFLGRKSDFAALAQGQTMTINSVTYTVNSFEHDPHGFPDWTLILLNL